MAADLGSYLREKGSPLADHVDSIYRAGNKYRVDPRLIVAISGGETSFGKAGGGPKHYNAWGIGPGIKYGSWDQGIDAAAKLLRDGYVGQGLTSLQAIQRKWAPVGAGNDPTNLNSNWVRTNTQFYSDLGGDPANVTKGWRKQAAPKEVAKRQRIAMPSALPPTPSQALSSLSSPLGGNPIQVALGNLGRIAGGEKPTSTLRDLVSASVQQTEARAAALGTQRPIETTVKSRQKTPDGGDYALPATKEKAMSKAKQRAVDYALSQIGKPYVWGAVGPSSFDCSGLVEAAYEAAGIATPGRLTTWSAQKLGHSVKGQTLEPGDWVITNKGKHMVMYIGGGKVVAAPHSGTNVQTQPLARFRGDIVDIRRYDGSVAR